jgi:penicillin-binding protein 1A
VKRRAAAAGTPGKPARRARAPRPTRPAWQRKLAFAALRWSATLAIWGLLGVGMGLAYYALTLPDISTLGIADRRPSVTLRAADGTLLATYGDLIGEPLRLKELPSYLPQAVIATEDRRFYSHWGIDPIGLARAAYVNLTAGRVVQGGSTITQQLAKNVFLTPERTFGRKIQETLLAFYLEQKFSKDQLLEIYLNRVYLGAGTYGVDAAAQRYFGKSARRVTVYEAAVIAGLLKAPTKFSPARDQARSANRTRQVLANMVAAGYLAEADKSAAERQGAIGMSRVARTRPGDRYFADWVLDQVAGYGGTGDLTVLTTLDPRIQAQAEKAIADMLAKDGAKSAVGQAALVALSPDGAVRAMVGGRDYGESQFNRATQALRQPGSAFKPFVYLAALERGMRPSDQFNDTPLRIGNWQPRNYTGKFEGPMTMADALANSINTVAIQVSERAGRSNVVAAARRLGITGDQPNDATLALGTGEVTLLELSTAYAAFATGGVGAWSYGIAEIRDAKGTLLYRREGGGPGRVISAEIAGQMNEMLTGVVTRGSGRAAALDRPVAGKTGTTQESKDAWFVGYTADLVAGVWLGNDDNDPMEGVSGGGLPARTWHDFMVGAVKGMPVRPLPGRPAPAAPAPLLSLDGIFGGLEKAISAGGGKAPPLRPVDPMFRTSPPPQQGGG